MAQEAFVVTVRRQSSHSRNSDGKFARTAIRKDNVYSAIVRRWYALSSHSGLAIKDGLCVKDAPGIISGQHHSARAKSRAFIPSAITGPFHRKEALKAKDMC